MYPLPLENEGFCKGFDSEDAEGIQQFFDTHGFVVIKQVLGEPEIHNTISEIWDQIELYSEKLRQQELQAKNIFQRAVAFVWDSNIVKRTNPHSSTSIYWPLSKHGIYPEIAKGQQIFENRQSLPIYTAFKTIIGTDDLLVSLDRFGFIPGSTTPTTTWLHWDLNPWFATKTEIPSYESNQTEESRKQCWLERWGRPNSAQKALLIENNNTTSLSPPPLQGFVALTDNKLGEGGFVCVPGFHKKLEGWAKANPKTTEFTKVNVPKDDEIIKEAVRVPVRAGDLLIWSSALPHCNYVGNKDRMVQYIKMMPASKYSDPQIAAARYDVVHSMLPTEFSLSPVGEIVFGRKQVDIKDNDMS